MDYVEIKLNKCVVYLSKEEIMSLLQKDLSLFKTALKRGKGITRHQQQKEREGQKWEREKGFN